MREAATRAVASAYPTLVAAVQISRDVRLAWSALMRMLRIADRAEIGRISSSAVLIQASCRPVL